MIKKHLSPLKLHKKYVPAQNVKVHYFARFKQIPNENPCCDNHFIFSNNYMYVITDNTTSSKRMFSCLARNRMSSSEYLHIESSKLFCRKYKHFRLIKQLTTKTFITAHHNSNLVLMLLIHFTNSKKTYSILNSQILTLSPD